MKPSRPRALEGEASGSGSAAGAGRTSSSDSMRGRSTTWTRIRLNLRHVPEAERPAEVAPDPDYDPWGGEGPSPPAMRSEYRRPKRKNPADGRL